MWTWLEMRLYVWIEMVPRRRSEINERRKELNEKKSQTKYKIKKGVLWIVVKWFGLTLNDVWNADSNFNYFLGDFSNSLSVRFCRCFSYNMQIVIKWIKPSASRFIQETCTNTHRIAGECEQNGYVLVIYQATWSISNHRHAAYKLPPWTPRYNHI